MKRSWPNGAPQWVQTLVFLAMLAMPYVLIALFEWRYMK